jgi:hypothetical protein
MHFDQINITEHLLLTKLTCIVILLNVHLFGLFIADILVHIYLVN